MGLGIQEAGRCGILVFRDQGVWGLEERSRKQKDRGCPERMGGDSVLDTSFLLEGGTSAFPPARPEGRVRAERAVASFSGTGLWDALPP